MVYKKCENLNNQHLHQVNNMKTSLIITICLLMMGCSSITKKESPTQIVKYKYIAYTVPSELLTIPTPITRIDPKRVTDKDIGIWIIDSERRSIELEKRLKAIKTLQEKQLRDLKKINSEDVEIH